MGSLHVSEKDRAALEHVLRHCPLPSFAPAGWRARILRETERMNRSDEWVVSHYPDGHFEMDGPHTPGSDLSNTLRILNRLCPDGTRFYKLTIFQADRYGTRWPALDSLAEEARAAGVAPPLLSDVGVKRVVLREPAADGSDCAYGVPGYSCVGSTDIRDTPCARCDA